MTDEDFEQELARRLREIKTPEDLERRLIAASRAWVPSSGALRRRRRHRRAAVLVAVGLALGGGTAAGVALFDPFDGGLSVPAAEPAFRELARSEILARAPWLRQPAGAPRIQEVPALPSLTFPPGTTYQEALEALFVSVVERGRLPAGAGLGKPLPLGVVWSPGTGGEPAALDLRAPWAFTLPGGRIRTPSYSLPGSLAAAEASAVVRALEEGRPLMRGLPPDVTVDTPALHPCQLGGRGGMACPFR